MNNITIKKSIFIVIFFSSHLLPVQSQEQDSLYHNTITEERTCGSTHKLKIKDIIVPTAIVGVSALYVNNSCLSAQKEKIQNALVAEDGKKFKLDDYLQYSPMAAVYALNLSGIDGMHNFKERTTILAMSYLTMGIIVNTMKLSFREKRPDTNARNSFPSGHTATAFMGAEFLYQEYKDVSPWIGYAGYAVAAATGYLRVYNNRHYINDVVAGACIGVMSTKLAYWLYPKCFKRSRCSKGRTTVAGMPYYSPEKEIGVCMYVRF